MSLSAGLKKHYFLHPGQIIVTADENPIVTVLGSCVALTVYSPERRVGGIFHALLPEYIEKNRVIKNSPPVSPDPDYVDYSFYYIKNRMSDLGIDITRTRLMLFGGGDVLQSLTTGKSASVGKKNIEMIKNIIEKEKLKISAEDTGGTKARKIVFHPGSGKTFLEYIECDNPEAGGRGNGKENRGTNRR
ncbi:MAG TPA: chemotaxis protein CheD [Spirochaetota bacterium]|nr:chemotaxis protein CheD [Spirochaetota bacterium]HRX46557.1 chemotaxis protein CheD [Spirochaetota bacterium]